MVSKGENKYVIWPIYFDKSVSRLAGRKISKKHAVEKPSIEDISKAAKSLGFNPILEKNCAHPSKQWKKEGRILIDKKDSKSKLLLKIANRLS
ncbi:MAG: signal recognition particle subunit SRP19/SEC65 family protein [Thermoplasmatales archaeon]|nr:MAG: signal recognition particle subunit SRP19/SEC65 family protein [Thermoplasmatales archaeon]